MIRPSLHIANDLCLLSNTNLTIYSLGILGSCLENMFFKDISASKVSLESLLEYTLYEIIPGALVGAAVGAGSGADVGVDVNIGADAGSASGAAGASGSCVCITSSASGETLEDEDISAISGPVDSPFPFTPFSLSTGTCPSLLSASPFSRSLSCLYTDG